MSQSDTKASPALARVAKGALCAGCGGCAAVAPDKITMAQTEPGYLRPVQTAPLDPAEETMIDAICPGLGQAVVVDGRTPAVLWGPYVEMQTGWATDPALRFAGSSGGALSALLVHLLESHQVDAIVQTAAAPDLAIGNATVITGDAAAVQAAAGSRYAPSAPLADLAARIASGKRHAFVGKPCDVAALRALANRNAAVQAAFPFILSFFCAGVPSHTGGRAVLEALGTTLEETKAFRFRGNGWPGRATATDHTGAERSMSYHDSWGKILSKHVQHRCKICADGTGVAADLVCADAWESDADGYPLFDEAPGVSLIVARTPLGAKVLAEAKAAKQLETAPFDVDLLTDIQPGQRERRRALLARLSALWLLRRPIPRYRGLDLRASARQNPIGRNLRNFAGMLRRTVKNPRPAPFRITDKDT